MQADTVDMQNSRQNANGHLDPERLAALDHEPATTDELAHLAGCAVCRAERQALIALQSLATASRMPSDTDAPRLTSWESLSASLRAEGLLTSPATVSHSDEDVVVQQVPLRTYGASPAVADATRVTPDVPHQTRLGERRSTPVWLRVAAAAMFTVGGAFVGRASVGAPVLPLSASGDTPSRAVSATDAEGGAFANVAQATESLYRAQQAYERASLWLASNDTTAHSSDVYRTRLAALDQMMASSRAALRDAPTDPILLHYFQSAYTAREATLKQLSVTLPVDKTLERY